MKETFDKRVPSFNEIQPQTKLWGTVENRKNNPELIALRLLQTSMQDTTFIEVVDKPRGGDTQWAQKLIGTYNFVYADERLHDPIRSIVNTPEITSLKAATQPPFYDKQTGEVVEVAEPTFEQCSWSDGREWDELTKRRLQALHAQTQLDFYANQVKEMEDPVERELLFDMKCIPYALRRNERLGLNEPIEVIRSQILTPGVPTAELEEAAKSDIVNQLTPVDYSILQSLVADVVDREFPHVTPRIQ